MNQFNQHKTNRPEIKFDAGMDFYARVGAILVELNPSSYMTENEAVK